MTVPVIATAAFAFIVLFIIVWEARANRTDMVIKERQYDRAVSLLNRVKIKYVNNTRTIDYMCMKFHVRNATELEFVYDQYQKAKREWARKRESVYILNEKKDILIAELKNIGVRDAEIWCSQVRAIIEPKEMVEVRHELNSRRQQLRKQIDYNTGIIQDFINELERIRNMREAYAQEVEDILGKSEMINKEKQNGGNV